MRITVTGQCTFGEMSPVAVVRLRCTGPEVRRCDTNLPFLLKVPSSTPHVDLVSNTVACDCLA